VKRTAIVHIVIGLIWVVLGVLAVIYKLRLTLFFAIPIPNAVVILIGVIWTGAAVFALIRAGQHQPDPSPV